MEQVIGLTGGIGAGKSTVLAELERLGENTVDADNIVSGLYESGDSEIVEPMVKRYGRIILTEKNRVDKKKLAQIIFENARERNWLNRLVHPHVLRILEKTAADVNGRLFFSIPLLFEVGWQQKFDHTISVWCDEKSQMNRLQKRGWSLREIKARRGAQMPMGKKNELADFVLVNNSSIDVLKKQLTHYLGIL